MGDHFFPWGEPEFEISYIDCPNCGAEKSIKVDKCIKPGFRCTDYDPCSKCGYEV